MKDVLSTLFAKYGFSESKALLLAEVHTQNTLYGVSSHGINRVPRFIDYVKKGVVKVDAEARKVEAFGNIERWDGNQGSGVINAVNCTNRAIALAKTNGMGLVALRNTNHWMRGGFKRPGKNFKERAGAPDWILERFSLFDSVGYACDLTISG